MFPIVLDLARLPTLLIGGGPQAVRRLRLLDDAGANDLTVFAARPGSEMIAAAGPRLRRRLPTAEDFAGTRVVLIADAGSVGEQVDRLVAEARQVGALVNVEDDVARSDFHTPSMIRRGDLLVTVSTNGRSPALAGRLRRALEQLLPPEWAIWLDQLGTARQRWRAEGLAPELVARRSLHLIESHGWLRGLEARPAPEVLADRRVASL